MLFAKQDQGENMNCEGDLSKSMFHMTNKNEKIYTRIVISTQKMSKHLINFPREKNC